MTEEPSFVFVSYASEDRELVVQLVRALERHGVTIRSDLDLGPGDSWQEMLSEWSRAATSVLVVWSASSARSSWVLSEASGAGNRLVPVSVAGNDVIPAAFRSLHSLDLAGWSGDPLDTRLESLAGLLLAGAAPRVSQSGPVSVEGPTDGASVAADPDRHSGNKIVGGDVHVTIVDAVGATDSIAVDIDHGAEQDREHLQVSASVRSARDELLGNAVTAAQIALALQPGHTDYGGGTFGKVVLDPEQGSSRPVDNWLWAVGELYGFDAVAASRHQVLDGRLVLAGLAVLDSELRAMLEADGFLSALRAELDVVPTAPPPAAPTSAEPFFDFSTDTAGPADEVRASDDRLGIEDDVRTLCRLALARSTKPPLAIGLFGDWGTGKSFFMRRMQTRVREMQREADASLCAGGTSPYCDNVAQISFNAWNYVDSNLWASLMTRIFEGLRTVSSDADRDFLFSQLAPPAPAWFRPATRVRGRAGTCGPSAPSARGSRPQSASQRARRPSRSATSSSC